MFARVTYNHGVNTMKVIILLSVLFLIGFKSVQAQETIGFTNPDATFHLEDYRLPDWDYSVFYLDFMGNINTVDQFNDAQSSSGTGRATPTYLFYRESEEIILDAGVSLPLQFSRQSSESATGNETTTTDFTTDFSAFGSGKYYLQDDIFATGGAQFDLNTFRRDRESDIGDDTFMRDIDSRIQLNAGAGIGRVRNVTPVIRALRFNERFNTLGAGDLGDDQIQDLASVFARRGGYATVFDRSNKLFWDEISDVAPDQFGELSFYEAYYLSETLLESTGQRFEGWDGVGEVFVDHDRFAEEEEVDGTEVTDESESDTQLGVRVRGRIYHNLSLEQMISARANIGGGVAMSSEEDDSESLFNIGFEVGHLYNITDRILLESSLGTDYESIGSGDDSVSFRTFLLNSGLTYFIENNVNVTLNLSYRNDKRDFGTADQTHSEFGANITLRYLFMQSLN